MDLVYVAYGLLIATLVVVSYTLGALKLLPYDPQQISIELLNAPPGSAGHLLGTDFLGRDILSRVIVGIQAYFLPGLLAIAISLSLGIALGVAAGYRGGGADALIAYF
ncbi:MAG: ABC transporter permease, partial [Terriglobales bacterium]